MPTFSVAAGTYATTQSVTISDATSGTKIYYTTDGTTPTTSSSAYSGAISISTTKTLEAIAVKTGYTTSATATATYTIAPALSAPVFSPAAGTYTSSQSVTISNSAASGNIYYTTDGTTPTSSSKMYAGAIWQSTTQTLKAIAIKTGCTNSAVTTAAYTIAPVLPAPTFSLPGGSSAYASAQTVTISDSVAAASIYYTTNGTVPTTSSTKYAGPITVSATETIEAIAIATGYTNSAVSSVLYTIASSALSTPTLTPASGTYTATQTITISETTAGTTIYYTIDGTTPTTSSTKYTGPFTVSTTATVKVLVVKTGVASVTATATYAIAPVLPTPTFSLAAGTYTTSQAVTISDATAGTTIYYTTDGTTPTTSSTKYTGAITVSTTETLKAIATKTSYTNSAAATATYTISSGGTTYISYASGGFTTSSLSLNNGTKVSSGILQVTDGGAGEIHSVWFTKKVPVSAFTSDFVFQILKASADGFTLTIQNDPKGIWALGYGGSGLGYQGIQKSVALKFDIYDNAGEGSDSIGVYTGGAVPTTPSTDLRSTGITLGSGNLIRAHLVYSGTTLTVTLTDTVTGTSMSKQFTVNIPTAVGGTTAYIGFTGSTGAFTSVQDITSWSYSAQ
jgi:hypothetical protein